MKFKKPNKKMFEYWLDEDEEGKIIPIKMPYKYVIESFCDMLGASKAYNPKEWKPEMLWNYWITKCKGKRIMNKESTYLLEKLIWNLYQIGEKEFFKKYKKIKKTLKKLYNESRLQSIEADLAWVY